jgi:D-sedoheptulose 7-phosphate isomerase
MSEQKQILDSIAHSAAVIKSLADQSDQIEQICSLIIQSLKDGNKVLTMGHGGSAAEALHMAEEFTGRFDADRPPLPAVCLAADPTLLTCIGNDYGFDRIFPRQVEAHGRPGDVLVIFSTSGNGDGLRMAIEVAKEQGVITVALLGKDGGPARELADHVLLVKDNVTARIQEAHQVVMHVVLEAVDRVFA